MPDAIATAVKDWWGIAITVFSFVFGLIIAKIRQQWRLDQIVKELERQDGRIGNLEQQSKVDAITLAEIRTTQDLILTQITQLRDDIKGKVDK